MLANYVKCAKTERTTKSSWWTAISKIFQVIWLDRNMFSIVEVRRKCGLSWTWNAPLIKAIKALWDGIAKLLWQMVGNIAYVRIWPNRKALWDGIAKLLWQMVGNIAYVRIWPRQPTSDPVYTLHKRDLWNIEVRTDILADTNLTCAARNHGVSR